MARSTERCEVCDEDTDHAVWVELVWESTDGPRAIYSKEPYRYTRCEQCGAEARQRMNNA